MIKLSHSVRRQSLEIDVDSEATALMLQSRLEDINRRSFLPVIERVLDEFAIPGRRLKLARLDIDLGALSLSGFETTAAERLYREMRSALETALRDQDPAADPRGSNQPEHASLVEMFESYLLRGSLPFWAPSGSVASLEDLITELIEQDPSSVASVIRRNGHRKLVLERLVLQLDDGFLARLLHLLEPEHAALIIAYLIDLKRVHRVEPIIDVSERGFSRLLWVLALAYLVRDAGSQFNRKSFVRSLLEGIARNESLDYGSILTTLGRGLEETETKISLNSSLPGVINALVNELDVSTGEASDRFEANRGQPLFELDESGFDEASIDLDALIEHIRANVSRVGLLERIVVEASEVFLRRLLSRLDPEHDELIIAYMIDLKEIHRVEYIPPISSKQFDRLLWLLVLGYEVRDPGSQFNRRSFVKSLLEGMAESEGLDYGGIVSTLALGLMETGKKASIKSSLPAVIGELFDELPDEQGGAQLREPRAGRGPFQTVRPATAAYDQFETLRYYLTHGLLPWHALLCEPGLTIEAAAAPLQTLSASQLQALLSLETGDARRLAVRRAVQMISEGAVQTLLAKLLGGAFDSGPFFEAVATFARESKDWRAFFVLAICSILDGQAIDLEAIAASAAEMLSEDAPLPGPPVNWKPHVLKSAIAAQLERRKAPVAAEHSLADLIQALMTRHPQDARHFFFEFREPERLSAIVAEQCPASVFDDAIELLRPAEADVIAAFTRLIAGIPAPYRPGADAKVQQAILVELLHLGDGRSLGEGFLLRVIRRLFATPLSERLSELFLREAAAWESDDPSLAEYAGSLKRAVQAAGTRANGGAHDEDHEGDENESAAVRGSSNLLDAIFDFLLGKTVETEPIAHTLAGPASPINIISSDALLHSLLVLLDESPASLISFIAREAADRRVREHWVKALPESVLVRISYLLAPRRHKLLMDGAEVLASAWLETAPPSCSTLTARRELWLFLLEFFSGSHGGDLSLKQLVAALFDHYAARYQTASPSAAEREAAGRKLFERAKDMASAGGRPGLIGVLKSDRSELLASWKHGAAARSAANAKARSDRASRPDSPRLATRGRTRFNLGESDSDDSSVDSIYIGNAGLVLAGPFLLQLFRSLDMLEQEENGPLKMRDEETASRAVHLLQYLVAGATASAEPLLILNKILCGIAVESPVERGIEATDQELESCDKLLKSMISNWTAIKNTSVIGLRETFLQREGKLDRSDDGWKLRVQRKTVDVLVDQIPWSVSVIYHPWMPKPIHVTW